MSDVKVLSDGEKSAFQDVRFYCALHGCYRTRLVTSWLQNLENDGYVTIKTDFDYMHSDTHEPIYVITLTTQGHNLWARIRHAR